MSGVKWFLHVPFIPVFSSWTLEGIKQKLFNVHFYVLLFFLCRKNTEEAASCWQLSKGLNPNWFSSFPSDSFPMTIAHIQGSPLILLHFQGSLLMILHILTIPLYLYSNQFHFQYWTYSTYALTECSIVHFMSSHCIEVMSRWKICSLNTFPGKCVIQSQENILSHEKRTFAV